MRLTLKLRGIIMVFLQEPHKERGMLKAWLDKAGTYIIAKIPCNTHFESSLVDLTKPRAGVLHTTECSWDAAMGVFRQHFAPQFLIGVNAHHLAALRTAAKSPPQPSGKAEIAQLVPVGRIGAALVTHNNLAIVQCEMVGYSQETPWLPQDGTLDALASLMLTCRDEYGIPLSHPWKDGDYGRYGDNPHRQSGKFGAVAGWFSHGDVKDNDHWDVGNLSWSKVFAHAKSLEAPSNVSVT